MTNTRMLELASNRLCQCVVCAVFLEIREERFNHTARRASALNTRHPCVDSLTRGTSRNGTSYTRSRDSALCKIWDRTVHVHYFQHSG